MTGNHTRMQSVAWGNHSHPSNPYNSRKSALKNNNNNNNNNKKREQTFVLLGWSISSSKPRSRYRLAFRIHPINPLRRIYPSSEPKICVLRLSPPLNVKLGNFTLKLKLCSDSNVMYCKVCCTCKVVLLMKPTAFFNVLVTIMVVNT